MSRNAISVLYVSPVAERGGAEAVLLNLLRFHDRTRFRPIGCFLRTGPVVDQARELAEVVVIPTGRLRSYSTLSAIRAIRRVIEERNVDVVFGNMTMGHVYGGVAAVGTKARAVWFEHGIIGAPEMLDRIAARVPAALTFTASAVASRARAALNGNTPIRVVPAGIDVDQYESSRYPRGLIRGAFGISSDAPVVACIARLQRWKGQSLFLRAASAIRRVHPNARFLVVGGTLFGLEAQYAEELKQEARALGVDDVVHFAGHRDDVPAVLASVDVLVHCPIRPEPFGLVVVEAMAMGVPVVSVTGSGPEEILTPETGILVQPDDADAIARAVTMLLQQPERRASLSRAARCRARERFSAARMVSEIERELEQVVAG